MTAHILMIHLVIGFFYGMIYGCANLFVLGEALFIGLFWPLDLARMIVRGARDWWG
jgi:hypothetical protein